MLSTWLRKKSLELKRSSKSLMEFVKFYICYTVESFSNLFLFG